MKSTGIYGQIARTYLEFLRTLNMSLDLTSQFIPQLCSMFAIRGGNSYIQGLSCSAGAFLTHTANTWTILSGFFLLFCTHKKSAINPTQLLRSFFFDVINFNCLIVRFRRRPRLWLGRNLARAHRVPLCCNWRRVCACGQIFLWLLSDVIKW